MNTTDWTYDSAEDEYLKQLGHVTVQVRRDVSGHWIAKIVSGRRYAYRLGFLSLLEAQVWAEQEAVIIRSADRRLNEREAGAQLYLGVGVASTVDIDQDRYMEWEQGPHGRWYKATADMYQAMLWKTSSGAQAALVGQYSAATAHGTFSIRKDAQAWCEACLAQVQSKERESGAQMAHLTAARDGDGKDAYDAMEIHNGPPDAWSVLLTEGLRLTLSGTSEGCANFCRWYPIHGTADGQKSSSQVSRAGTLSQASSGSTMNIEARRPWLMENTRWNGKHMIMRTGSAGTITPCIISIRGTVGHVSGWSGLFSRHTAGQHR